MAIVKIFSF